MGKNKYIRIDKDAEERKKALSLTPREIVAELDKFIIGQDAAKKSVAIALRNRWRRQNVHSAIREEIMPNNIIMIGPTGVGKTEIARRLAKLAGAPFIKVEATKFTEVGYVGRDVESMIRDLVDLAISMVRSEKWTEIKETVKNAAENRILDILLPSLKERKSSPTAEYINQKEQTENSRAKFRKQLRNLEIENREIEIDIQVDQMPSMQVMGPIGMDDLSFNIHEMFGGMSSRKTKRRKVKISEARVVFEQEESEKLIDFDAVVKEATKRVETLGIVFVDEIDKIASNSGSGNAEVSRQGVQRDLLPIVEGTTVSTKYGVVKTDHILFIASGAFHVSKPSDLIPELQGRFPIRVELQSLTEDDLFKILTIPENALIKQYQALLATENIEIEFQEDALREIASIAASVNEDIVNIGARRLHTILTTLLEEILFDASDADSSKNIIITADLVRERLSSIVKNQDLSKYIL